MNASEVSNSACSIPTKFLSILYLIWEKFKQTSSVNFIASYSKYLAPAVVFTFQCEEEGMIKYDFFIVVFLVN